MPKYIDSQTDGNIIELLSKGLPKVKIAGELGVSDNYIRKIEREHKATQETREETPVETYRKFSTMGKMRHDIEAAFATFEHLLLQHAAREAGKRTRVKLWLNRHLGGVDVEFSFDGPGGEIPVPISELHNFLLSEHLLEIWRGVYDLYAERKKKTLEIIGSAAELEQAREVADVFLRETNTQIAFFKKTQRARS